MHRVAESLLLFAGVCCGLSWFACLMDADRKREFVDYGKWVERDAAEIGASRTCAAVYWVGGVVCLAAVAVIESLEARGQRPAPMAAPYREQPAAAILMPEAQVHVPVPPIRPPAKSPPLR